VQAIQWSAYVTDGRKGVGLNAGKGWWWQTGADNRVMHKTYNTSLHGIVQYIFRFRSIHCYATIRTNLYWYWVLVW